MNFVLIAVVGAIVMGVAGIVNRLVAKDAPIYGFTLGWHFFGALFALPLFLLNVTFPTEPIAWWLLAASVTVWTGGMLLNSYSLKHTHVSVRAPVLQTQLLWMLVFAVVILHESLTLLRAIGGLLVFAGALLVSVSHLRKSDALQAGVIVTAITAVTWAIASVIDKQAMAYFEPTVYNFLEYAIIFCILLVALKPFYYETRSFLRAHWLGMVFVGLFSTSAYLVAMIAYSRLDLSVATPIFEAGTVITVIIGMLLFKEERTHIARKLTATALMIIGAVMVALG